MRTLKVKTDNAIRHGAAWFGAAGLSGGVFIWIVIVAIKNALN